MASLSDLDINLEGGYILYVAGTRNDVHSPQAAAKRCCAMHDTVIILTRSIKSMFKLNVSTHQPGPGNEHGRGKGGRSGSHKRAIGARKNGPKCLLLGRTNDRSPEPASGAWLHLRSDGLGKPYHYSPTRG